MTHHPATFKSNGNRVLLIGWDAADWKVLGPLLERGRLPNLLKLVERGVKGNIATLHPVLSPMLWTSIATGKRPDKHGICGFYEPAPDGMSVQPITNLSRKTKAIWNILTQTGLKTNVVGWWPSHPAEPVNGVMVSDLFHKNTIRSGLSKTVPIGAVHPESLTDELGEFRFDVSEWQVEDLLNFIPRAREIDQSVDRRLIQCARVLAECTTVHATATHLMETTGWDFMAVYYDAIDHFSHMFMRYHPPRREMVPERDYELFRDVVTAACIYHDMMLGRLVELAGEETTIVLLSDHGFHPDHLRPDFIPVEPAGPAVEHRDLGVFVMAGPGITRDQLVFGTTLLDVTPTILAHMGLPVGEDMDGRVVTEIFESAVEVRSVPSWDDIPGDDGSHPAGMALNPQEAETFLQQLVDLGYIDELSADRKQNVDNAIRELNYNRARACMDANRYADALPVLAELYEKYPDAHRIGMQLALCYKALGYAAELQGLVEQLTERRINAAIEARAELRTLNRLIEERRGQLPPDHPGLDSQTEWTHARVVDAVLDEAEKHRYLEVRSLASVRTCYLDFLRGYALCALGQNDEALVFLKRAIDAEPRKPSLYIQAGEAYLNLQRLEEARAAFQKALSLDDTSPAAHLAMAQYCLLAKKNEQAIRHGLDCVAITYFNPMAHYVIGVGLWRTGRYEQAFTALQNAIGQNPNFAEACDLLATLSEDHFQDAGGARHFRELATRAREFTASEKVRLGGLVASSATSQTAISSAEPPAPAPAAGWPGLRALPNRSVVTRAADLDPQESVVVVTGLPRAGTSMMMQMLRAGGMTVLEDAHRPADEDNPRGYLELRQARSLLTDNRWVDEARGKAIKVVAPLLEGLPARFQYKVILMVRRLEEIAASQTAMLERSGKRGSERDSDRLSGVLKYQFETAARLLNDKGISTLRVPYPTAIARPREVARSVNEFLGMDLDIDRMASQVDDSLYRNRATSP